MKIGLTRTSGALIAVAIVAALGAPLLLRQPTENKVEGNITTTGRASPAPVAAGLAVSNSNSRQVGVESSKRSNEQSRARTEAVFPPLPPDNVPLRQVAESLHTQALAGNYRAACRLSYELNRCQQLPIQRELVDSLAKQLTTTNADPKTKALLAASQAEAKNLVEKDSALCAEVDENKLMRPWQYLLMAAQAGHIPSMVRFASTPPMDEQSFIKDLDGWGVYKQNAIPLLQEAMNKGNTTALTELGWIYAGFPAVGGSVVERDPALAIRYTQAALRLSDATGRAQMERRLDMMTRGMNPADVLQAKNMGDDLYLKKFAMQSNINTAAPLHKDNGEDCRD